jgi:membrane-associated phospholipid phosphatase
MNSAFKIIHQNLFFYTINGLLFIALIILSCVFSHSQGFIWLNQTHTKVLTHLFEGITFFGDGWFIILLSIYLLLFSKKNKELAFIILLSYISSGIFSQLLKNCISSPRPSTYFEIHHYKYYLETFAKSRVGYNSFPSGHTASFFALATVITNYFRQKHICFTMIILSIAVGYSRIYLGHHFLIDVIFGASIGVFFGSFSAVWAKKITKNTLIRKKIKKWKRHKTFFPNPSFNN